MKLEQMHTGDKDWQNRVKTWRNELENIRKDRLRGSLIRSRAQYITLSVNCSKIFPNKE